MTAPQDALLAAALRAADRGWHVFPLRPGDKRPAISRWEERATTDAVRIRACWASGPYNVGIACGPSGLVVLDLDMPKPGATGGIHDPDLDANGRQALARLALTAGHAYPDHTYAVTTRAGGTHLYFAQPAGLPLRNTAGRLGPLIDTRGHGGYVVAAGSCVTGRSYSADNGQPVASLPAWLHEALHKPPPLAGIDPGAVIDKIRHTSRYAAAALAAEVDRVQCAQPGTRNHTLNTAAYSLGQLVATGLLTPADTTTALAGAALTSGLDAREIDHTIRSGLHAGTQHPRQVHS